MVSLGNILALAAVVAPPLSVLAPLALAPLLALVAAALAASGGRRCVAALRPLLPLAVLLVLLSLWAALSTLWSPIPAHSLFEAGRLLVICGAGLVTVGAGASLTASEAERLRRAAIIGVAGAVALLQFERWSGGALLRLLHGSAIDPAMLIYRYDRGVTFLLLAAWPAAAAVAARRGIGALLVGTFAVAVTVLEFKSQTAMLAGAIGIVAALIAWRLPRTIAAVMVGGALLLVLVSPLIAPGGTAIEQIRQATPTLKESAIHRLIIWHFTADRIAERPVLGWGMDASRAIPGGEAHASEVMPEVKLKGIVTMLPLHPHDAALQWRLELGLPGALLCLTVLGLVLWRIAASPHILPLQRGLALGCATAVLTIALLSFGAWQAWWLSSIWLTAGLFAGVQPRPDS
jgi:exopolysaccharide production protein ExoQ